MSVIIAHASLDENKNIKNGKAGDQTGKEVCTRSWYNKPWGCVIRFTDTTMAEKVAKAMEWAAENDNIGYDQNQRNTLLSEARKVNFNLSKVKVKCETDCSALVAVACMYAGVPESALTLQGNCAHTRNLKQMLKSTGEVQIFTTALYTSKTDKLKRGDILLKEGSHVAVVVRVDLPVANTNNSDTMMIDKVAKEVIAGKWGTGAERKQRLRAAGYNPAMVQARVNEMLKKG